MQYPNTLQLLFNIAHTYRFLVTNFISLVTGQAYFPSINQAEGLPLNVQDIKGKEWVFQFRFWPNNNSRMYVLEGITPCIQSMQLQAGDVGNLSVPPNAILLSFFLCAI